MKLLFVKLLFDQNLSRKLVTQLADIYPNSTHVCFHDFAEADDREIWEFAKERNFCIVTQDADFADCSRLYGSPPKVIWLRCGNAPTARIETILRSAVQTIDEFIESSTIDCLELY